MINMGLPARNETFNQYMHAIGTTCSAASVLLCLQCALPFSAYCPSQPDQNWHLHLPVGARAHYWPLLSVKRDRRFPFFCRYFVLLLHRDGRPCAVAIRSVDLRR